MCRDADGTSEHGSLITKWIRFPTARLSGSNMFGRTPSEIPTLSTRCCSIQLRVNIPLQVASDVPFFLRVFERAPCPARRRAKRTPEGAPKRRGGVALPDNQLTASMIGRARSITLPCSMSRSVTSGGMRNPFENCDHVREGGPGGQCHARKKKKDFAAVYFWSSG